MYERRAHVGAAADDRVPWRDAGATNRFLGVRDEARLLVDLVSHVEITIP
jgi:hypothetical protein